MYFIGAAPSRATAYQLTSSWQEAHSQVLPVVLLSVWWYYVIDTPESYQSPISGSPARRPRARASDSARTQTQNDVRRPNRRPNYAQRAAVRRTPPRSSRSQNYYWY